MLTYPLKLHSETKQIIMKPESNYYQFIRPEMAKFIERPYKKILEIGCGEGRFRDHFSDDHEYWGVELNSEAVFK